MRDLRNLAFQVPVETILRTVIERMELIQHLDRISKSSSEFEERKQNVEELQKATRRYTAQGSSLVPLPAIAASSDDVDTVESPLCSFLDDVALVTDLAERSAEERFVVNLMTIHASKGKEFDTVFVVGNEDRTFPSAQALEEGEGSVELEEEKRLCYVAMTRAKTELFLTWRNFYGQETPEGWRQACRKRSRFLDILVGDKGRGILRKKNSSLPRSQSPSTVFGSGREGRSSPEKKKATEDRLDDRQAPRHRGGAGGSSSSTMARAATPRYPSRYTHWRASKPFIATTEKPSKLEGANGVYASERWHQQPPRRRRERDAAEAAALYFPAGTIVIHKSRGKGVVISRNGSHSDPELVHVKFFASGTVGRFSPHSPELFPDMRSSRDGY
jgi:hypothetical protein